MRRLMLQVTEAVAAGRDPLGTRGSAHTVRPAEMVLPEDTPWQDALKDQLVARWQPDGQPDAAGQRRAAA